MISIKLTTSLDLQMTKNEPIYRGENMYHKILFLVPKMIGDIDIATAFLYLSYIRADGFADIALLETVDEYNENWYTYTLPVSTKLSRFPGEIVCWLQIYTGSPRDPVILKSSECVLRVTGSKNMDDYICDNQMSILYDIHHSLSRKMSKMEGRLTEAINLKGDNIVFDPEDSTIQLTSDGNPIGDKIYVSTKSGVLVSNIEINEEGNLIVTYDDESTQDLGKAVGKDGKVYVPHIDEHKVLTFTIEDEPKGLPDEVDLNPYDDWSEMEDEGSTTDYVWESL